MTKLEDYACFNGRHWETGSVHNYYAYRAFKAPHTGQPYSEALLLGVSGGIVVGYFNFLYEGYDPQCNILTRNTFDPWDTMLSRLGVMQNVEHSTSARRAEVKLKEALADGVPAILWADRWSLPYNGLDFDKGMWGAFPILVYGYDEAGDVVHVADRASVPLTVTTAELAAARGRIKKDKFRLITLEAPDEEKLAAAVSLGICDTIKLFTEKPPRGSKNNFGLNALEYWARMLRRPKQRQSWEKNFPPGLAMYAGLKSAFEFAFLFGKNEILDAERGLYADFLDEAALILDRPGLAQAAGLFREAGAAWTALAGLLLPDAVEPFGETRRLMQRRHTLFLAQGGGALVEMGQINDRLAAIRQAVGDDFPLTDSEAAAFREALAGQLLRIREVEEAAVAALAESAG